MQDRMAAPGRLGERLRLSLSGHHALFDVEDIRAALAADEADEPAVSAEHAGEVSRTLVALARDAVPAARNRVDALPPGARDALIRLYFRLLERSREVRGTLH